ncbi:MAG: hypothetical protein ABI134_04745 [Byssovorax sp.]
MSADILEKRLQAEAERQGVSVAEVHRRMLALGLDAAKERRNREAKARTTSVDILLVTATTTEHRELRDAARAMGLLFDKRQGRLGTYYHLGQVGNDRVASIQVKMGAFGSEGSAARCIQARAETQATTLILLGTAFGVNRTQQRIGDVLVSESVFLYDDRHAVDASETGRIGSTLEAFGEYVDTATSDKWTLVRRVRAFLGPGYVLNFPSARRQASLTWVERFRRTADEFARMGEPERVIVGTLLSGGARIESARFRDDLIANIPAMEPQVVGGEMEAVGAVSAATNDDIDEPGWIVVKGISDFADTPSRAKIEESRNGAARSAARVVLRTLQSLNRPT